MLNSTLHKPSSNRCHLATRRPRIELARDPTIWATPVLLYRINCLTETLSFNYCGVPSISLLVCHQLLCKIHRMLPILPPCDYCFLHFPYILQAKLASKFSSSGIYGLEIHEFVPTPERAKCVLLLGGDDSLPVDSGHRGLFLIS